MIADKILKLANSWLKGINLEALYKMPSLVVVENLEQALKLQRVCDPKKYLIVHSPDIIDIYRRQTNKLDNKHQYKGILIEAGTMRSAMTELYRQWTELPDDTEQSLKSLEQYIAETSASRAENMNRLEEAAKALVQDGSLNADEQQVLALIQELSRTQTEYPEHLGREAVQNADGAWEQKSENRIDAYIDSENKLFTMEDIGRGMTREVMEDAFFNIYASLNEALGHAAGKFGIGAISFFGAGHEYVVVDSLTRDGKGGRAIVDAQLRRGDFSNSKRKQPGTTVEIKFSEQSEVDFDRLVQILKEDCCYIETPLYLHRNGSVTRLNKPLTPESTHTTLSFTEDNIEGYITKTPGRGKLDLLDHRIRLHSIETQGYNGAVNCSGLDTTFCRDTVMDDPVLRNVLAIIDAKRRELQKATSEQNMSLEARIRKYHDFVHDHLYKENNTPNEQWIRENFDTIVIGDNYKAQSEAKKIGGRDVFLFYKSLGLPFVLPIHLYRSIRNKRKKGSLKVNLGSNVRYGAYTAFGSTLTGLVGSTLAYLGAYSANSLGRLSSHTLDSFGDYLFLPFLTGSLEVLGISLIAGIPGGTYGFIKDMSSKPFIDYYYNKINNNIDGLWGYIKEKLPHIRLPSLSTVQKSAVVICVALGLGVIIGYSLYAGKGDSIWADDSRHQEPVPIHMVGGFESRQALAESLNSPCQYDNILDDTNNYLWNIDGTPWWGDQPPFNELIVSGWDVELPQEIAQKVTIDSPLQVKLYTVREYVFENFEYDVIPPEVASEYADRISAIAAEKKADCDEANTYAALLLSELDVDAVRYHVGNCHGWLEVNTGTAEYPYWQRYDNTPIKTNPELERMLEQYGQDSIELNIPFEELYQVLTTTAPITGLGGLGGFLLLKRKREQELLKRYNRSLGYSEQITIDWVKKAIEPIPGEVDVYYGANLGEQHPRFYLKPGHIVLNRTKFVDPYMVALGYAANILKNEKLATAIANK